MANINAPYGLRPVKQLDGSSWNAAVNVYFIPQADTNEYFIGDVVQAVAGGDTRTGAPAVELAGTRGTPLTAGNLRGAIVATGTGESNSGGFAPVAYDPENLNIRKIPSVKEKDYFVWVADSPSTIFEAQTDSIEADAFNKNAPLNVGVAPVDPITGSTSGVQGSAAAVDATLPLKVLGGRQQFDNELASPGTDARVFVLINTHELASNTVGV